VRGLERTGIEERAAYRTDISNAVMCTVEVEGGINRLVCIESTVEVSAKQSPICLEIIILYSWGVGRWLEEDFEHYGIVIGGMCRDCFRFR
jgi:hypothetical protein